MSDALFQALAAALSIWLSKEKTKYQDKLIGLRKAYYEEDNKPADTRDDAVLDNLRFELRLLAIGFATEVGKQNTQNQP